MIWKKCSRCDKRIRKKHNYCPNCGINQLTGKKDRGDYGMLGESDSEENRNQQLKLPFGLNTIMNTMIKQLEKEMGNIDFSDQEGNNRKPKGFKIKISTGKPNVHSLDSEEREEVQKGPRVFSTGEVNDKEKKRRATLERKEASSKIRRLPEGIFYEIETPGVSSIKDVVLTKLESSLEVKAYSKDACYVKTIPVKAELLGYSVKNNKVLLKLKN